MTFEELIRRLARLDARVEDRGGRPFLVFPPGVATPGLAAEIGSALAEFRVEVQCHFHPGRACGTCKGILFVDDPALVRLVCWHPLCPSYDRRLWPDWQDSFRWWEEKKRADRERLAAETIPE